MFTVCNGRNKASYNDCCKINSRIQNVCIFLCRVAYDKSVNCLQMTQCILSEQITYNETSFSKEV